MIEKHATVIEEIYAMYDPIGVLLKEFKDKRKNYNHYTEKIKKLEKEKQMFEDQARGTYSKKDLERLLRVGPV